MTSAEPNEMMRPHAAEAVEPLWHVRLPSGMVTMTLDDLDAAFQRGSISEQTLIARQDESCLRPLGVVAGLFDEPHRDDPRSAAQWSRSDVSGVRPAAHAQRHFQEPALANASTWTLLERPVHAEPSREREAAAPWQSAPQRWLRQAPAALRPLLGHCHRWFAARSPGQRWALGGVLLASLAAVCAFWPAPGQPSAPALGASPAEPPRSPPARTAAVASAQKSPVMEAAEPSATPSLPSRAVALGSELDRPSAKEPARRASAFAERRKPGRSEGGRRSSRRARAAKHRAGRE
jgi:hypothetical protein